MSESTRKDVDDTSSSSLAEEADSCAFRVHVANDGKNLQCRFYEQEFPEAEDVIMVKVDRIEETGVYCSLLEYNDIEGMIVKSEVSPRSVMRSIHNHVRVNRNEAVRVLKVDKAKGYIDLSKRRVSTEEVAECQSRFKRSKQVHGILRHVAKLRNVYLKDLYTEIGWPLYRKYGHAFDAFHISVSSDRDISGANDPLASINIPEDLKSELKALIHKRIMPKPFKIRSDIAVTCYSYEGIDAIREALLAGMEVGEQVEIKLMVSPLYAVSTTVFDGKVGIELLNSVIDVIQQKIMEKGGELQVKMDPRAVTRKDETALLRQTVENEETQDNDELDEDELLE